MCCDVVPRFARRVVCAALFVFTLSIHASSSVTLAWTASTSPNVTSYSLRYGTVPGSYPATIDAGNALTATVTNLAAGTTYYFVVYACNSSGLDSDPSNPATYTVPSTPPTNVAPTLNALGNITLNEDAAQQTVNLSGIGSGALNEIQTLSVTASSSNPGLVPIPTVTYTSPNTNGTLLFTPVANASGTATLTVTVNDGQALNNTVSRTFTVTVNGVNDPPTLNALNNLTLSLNAGLQTVSLSGIASGAANESQTLTVAAASSNPGLVPTPTVTYASPNATGTLRFTPVANATGTATVTVTVNDGQAQNNVVTRTFTVTVSAAAPQTIYVEAESGTRTGPMVVGANANASNGQYVYSQTANQGTVSFPVNISQAGDYWVWGRVLSANSKADSFYVSVDGGTEVIYLTAQNTWSSAWQWTQVNASGSPRSYTLGLGTHTLTFRGRESSTFLDALYITKDPNFVPPTGGSNLAPTLNALGNVTLNEDAPQQTVNLSGIGSGAAGEIQTLTVTASSSNPGLIPNPSVTYSSPNTNGTLRFTPVANGSGTATLTVTVNDGQALNNLFSRTFMVTINPFNDPPTISNIGNRSTTVNTAPTIPFTVNDADTALGSLTLNKGSSNPTLVPTNNIVFGGSGANRTVTVTPAAGQTGNATITVTASDGALSASDTFVLTVNPSVSGLVAAYGFNEGTGTTVMDASGNGNGGTINGATWTTGGRYGGALSFNGSSSYVDLGNPAALQLAGSKTWSAWVRAGANPPDDGQIIAKADDLSGWQLKTSPDTGPHTFGVKVTGGGGAGRRYSTTVRALSVWYHVAGVYNATAGTMDVYVNGVLDNGALLGTVPAAPVNANVNVNIGRRTGGFYFNGIIDEVRIYNRALSAAEIQTDMNTPLSAGSAPAGASVRQPPKIASLELDGQGAVILTVTGESGESYAVEASIDLVNWTRIDVKEASNHEAVFTEPASPGIRFYRAVSVASPVGPTQ